MKDNNKIVIYQNEKGIIELRADIEKDTIWATQAQIAQLFEKTISFYILHILIAVCVREDGSCPFVG